MAPNFPHHIRGAVLWDTGHRPSGLRLRGYHPLWRPIPGDFGSTIRTDPRPITPHSSMVAHGGSVWASPRSLAVTKGIPFWFLFLPLLGCFRSGGSRSQARGPGTRWLPTAGGPIRRSPDRSPPAATRGLSQLATSFVSAQAEASTGWRAPA